MIGSFAVSKAGHDKGNIYIVTGENEKYVYLCDGRYKKLSKPKRKNRKHVEILKMNKDIKSSEISRDEQIKRLIKIYNSNLTK